jgi:hypothetical protein
MNQKAKQKEEPAKSLTSLFNIQKITCLTNKSDLTSLLT